MMYDIPLYKITPEEEGIFTSLNRLDVPWKGSVDPDILDMEYYGNISGNKVISPLAYKNLSYGVLTVAKQRKISDLIFYLYGINWVKEWNTLSKQYDPIANYDMTEIMEDDETVIEYGKTEDTTTGNTHTKTGTETETPSVTLTTDDSVYGFNSSDDVPSNTRQESQSGSNELEYDTSETDSGSVGVEHGGSDTHTRNYTLTRKGNIGVTTSQQLLQAERDLWMWNFFHDVVFPDIDEVLTIPVFSNDEYEITSQVPSGTIEIVENGIFDVTSYALADVDVPNSYTVDDQGKVVWGDILISQTTRNITENGRYDTTLNNDTVVNVPNSYTVSDEGKVVDNGELIPQTPISVTENGIYNTTKNNSVSVNVAGVQPTGNINITSMQQVDVSQYATAQVVDVDIIPANIRKDVNILGVVGSLDPTASIVTPYYQGLSYAYLSGSVIYGYATRNTYMNFYPVESGKTYTLYITNGANKLNRRRASLFPGKAYSDVQYYVEHSSSETGIISNGVVIVDQSTNTGEKITFTAQETGMLVYSTNNQSELTPADCVLIG